MASRKMLAGEWRPASDPLDLAIGPWMFGLGRAVLDVVRGAGVFEGMCPEEFAVCDGFPDQRHGRAAGAGRRELDAVVGEYGVDFVRNRLDQT